MLRGTTFAVALGAAACAAAPAAGQTYAVAANPQGSLFYATGAAISKVMVAETGLQFRVAPYAGSSTYLPLINNGEVAFGMSNGAEYAFAYSGTELFRHENKKLRTVAVTFPTNSGFAVRNDSPIKTVADLKGKRVPVGYNSGRIFHYLAGAALATAGLTEKDLNGVPTPNFIEGVKAFMSGRVDAAYIPLNAAIGREAMASIPGGWRYITFENSPAAEKKMDAFLPSSRPGSVKPGPNAVGVVQDPTTFVQVDFNLVAGAEVPDEIVYKVAKTLHAKKADLVQALGAFRQFEPKQMARKHPVPYHPGAVKFYQEIGQWPPK